MLSNASRLLKAQPHPRYLCARMSFTLQATDPASNARAGALVTDHGSIPTPVFKPVGTLAMLLAITVGAGVGAIAGYFRARVDAVLMRAVDVGLAVPRIFVVLMIMAVSSPPFATLILIIGLTSGFGTSRLVRAEVLSVRERDYVSGARALGAGAGRVIVRHVLPNTAAPIIVSAALGIGNVMLLEAGLSFLGIGVQPPMASWGVMIADGQDYLTSAPWVSLFPGLAVALVVMALNAIGDALRDALDPRAEAA